LGSKLVLKTRGAGKHPSSYFGAWKIAGNRKNHVIVVYYFYYPPGMFSASVATDTVGVMFLRYY
jgi:hypothetical protein